MSRRLVSLSGILWVLAGIAHGAAPLLQSIVVAPPNPTIVRGGVQQFTATGNYNDGTTLDLTSLVTWASATPAVAQISSSGLATGLGSGTSAMSATIAGVAASTTLTVTGGLLQAIAVTPASPTITKGSTQQFTATGSYSDSTIFDLTLFVTWDSLTPSVAAISHAGLATGVQGGSSTVRAALGGLAGSTALTVTGGLLQSLSVTPPNPTIAKGSTQQFMATGTYNDATTMNLTPLATWTSLSPAVASVSSGGLATGIQGGTSAIGAAIGGVAGSTTITVTGGLLQSIAVTPPNPTVTKGSSQQFTAAGNYNDGSTLNLTALANWASATPAVAMISSTGLATAVQGGTSAISAGVDGILGSTTLTVAPATPAVVSFSVLFGSSSFDVIGSSRNRLPWQITGIRVVFSEAITAGTVASLGGITATSLSGLGTNILTWTFNPISIGSFATTLAGSGPNALLDSSGNPLGGGAGFTRSLKILRADVNDDGIVNAQDLALVNSARSQPYNILTT